MVTKETEREARDFLAHSLANYEKELAAEPVQITMGYRQFVALLAQAMDSAATTARLLTEARLKP